MVLNSAPCCSTGHLQPAVEPPNTSSWSTQEFRSRVRLPEIKRINEEQGNEQFINLKRGRKNKRNGSITKLKGSLVGVCPIYLIYLTMTNE